MYRSNNGGGGTPTESVAENVSNSDAAHILASKNSGVKPQLSRLGYRFAKRAFDLVASAIAIVILLIPGIILAIVICAKSPGASPIYVQTRVGRVESDGRYHLFKMFKFRSMVPNAEALLEKLKDKNEAEGPLFKIKDDPRVIPGVGAWIRKHSIDELPQLLNVFIGNMSLIGPRPGLPKEVLQYDERALLRLRVKPGCGGAWQTRNRNNSCFAEMIEQDLEYIERSGPGLDLQLIGATVKFMVVGEEA